MDQSRQKIRDLGTVLKVSGQEVVDLCDGDLDTEVVGEMALEILLQVKKATATVAGITEEEHGEEEEG